MATYLEGIDRFPGDPFLKFRLVDLCLITYQLDRARQLLTSLRASYLQLLLTDTAPSDTGFFRILHGSWEAQPK